jgi:hypothetical protein
MAEDLWKHLSAYMLSVIMPSVLVVSVLSPSAKLFPVTIRYLCYSQPDKKITQVVITFLMRYRSRYRVYAESGISRYQYRYR